MLSCQKHLFSLPEDEHYLNCAQKGPFTKATEAAGIAGIKRKSTPSGILPEHFFSEPEALRQVFAPLVNCSPEQVALIPSVSYGVAIATYNLDLKPGQNIVMPDEEFPSDVYAWRDLCARTGAELRMVPRPKDIRHTGSQWSHALAEAVDENTAALSHTIIHWTDGTLFDLNLLGQKARSVGALYILDGTQSVGALPFDFAAVKPDLLLCAAYKWLLGPYQYGFAVVGDRLIEGRPFEFNWSNIEQSEDFSKLIHYRDGFQPGARRFDVGEHANWIAVPMLRESLRQIMAWGVENIPAYCEDLVTYLENKLAQLPGGDAFRIAPKGERAGHMFGVFLPEGADPVRVAEVLRERKIFVSVRGAAVRVSPHLYTTRENMDALAEGLVAAIGG